MIGQRRKTEEMERQKLIKFYHDREIRLNAELKGLNIEEEEMIRRITAPLLLQVFLYDMPQEQLELEVFYSSWNNEEASDDVVMLEQNQAETDEGDVIQAPLCMYDISNLLGVAK